MKTSTRRALLALLLASIVLAVLGQYYFARKRAFVWDGIALMAVGMVLFAWVSATLEARSAARVRGDGWSLWRDLWALLRRSNVRLGLALLGTVLVVYVSAVSNSRFGGRPYYDLLALWIVGLELAAGAFVDWASLRDRLCQPWRWIRKHGREVALVSLMVAGTILVRAINLERIPYVLSGDEASMGLEAVNVLQGRQVNPFVTGWLSHPTLYFFIQALFLRLFGITTGALRLSSALVSGGIALLLYLYARRAHGVWVAVLATLFFMAYHYALHFGRIALNNIWDPFFALSAFYFLTVGLEDKRSGLLVVGGVLTGLAIYFYMGARLVPIILAVYLGYWLLTERDFLRNRLADLVISGWMAILAAMPLLGYFRSHMQDLLARWKWLGIFPSGWVDAQVQQTGKTALAVVFGQFTKSVLAFNFSFDPTFHYRPDRPLLLFVSSILFVFGLTYAVRNIRKRECFLLVVWPLLVVIFGSTLLENPPSSPRLVLSIPAVAMLVALGMTKVSSYLQKAFGAGRGLAITLSLVLLLVVGYQSLSFYFGIYTKEQMYSDGNTAVADRLGKYVRALGSDYQCYFFGPPRIYYNHATVPFLAQGIIGVDVRDPVVDRIDFVSAERNAVFVFLPERQSEFDVVRRFYPSGLLREFRSQKGQLLFVSYEVQVKA